MRVLLAAMLVLPAAAAAATDYVGEARCRGCHPAAWAQWRATPHADTAVRLTPAERVDLRCAPCHATELRAGLLGVQCEACHGAGGRYWPAEIMRDGRRARAAGLSPGGDETACRRCHLDDGPNGPFDYPAALERIRHEGSL